jgi:hypothetical protein
MRRLWLQFYLWLHGYATCEHPASMATPRYCLTCLEEKRAIALMKYRAKEAKLEAMREELRGK